MLLTFVVRLGAVRLRLRSAMGEYVVAETAASMSSKGIVCSTRVVAEEEQ